jgi:hypothetical protein
MLTRVYFPKSDIRKIPRATLSEWRKTPISKFVNQFENGAEHPTVIKYLSRRDEELERSKQAIDSYMTFVSFIKDAMGDILEKRSKVNRMDEPDQIE